jgi:hypothetical protein
MAMRLATEIVSWARGRTVEVAVRPLGISPVTGVCATCEQRIDEVDVPTHPEVCPGYSSRAANSAGTVAGSLYD